MTKIAIATILLSFFMMACTQQSTIGGATPDSDAVDNALRADPADGFAMVETPQPLTFPEDHLLHGEYRTEWWYLTGNLHSADGRRFGFQVTWFRQGMTLEPLPANTTWGAQDAWMAHVGLTDVEGQQFHQAHRFSRGAGGLAGAEAKGDTTEVYLDRWQLDLTESATAAKATLRIAVDTEHTALTITGTRLGPTVLRGDRGLSQKSATKGNASMYYVWPRIAVEGTVVVHGEQVPVSGLAWMDREWGSSLLDEDQEGWDWFALHLDDGSDLMVYSLRRKDGGIDPFAVAHRTSKDGLNERWSPQQWSLKPLRWWESPHTGSRWPIAWQLTIPGSDLDLKVEAVIPDQEHHGAFAYWEGTVDVTDAESGTNLGLGYLEMTGH